MKESTLTVLLAVMLFAVGLIQPSQASADVRIGVTVPLPSLGLVAPPPLVIIPGSYAYFAPYVHGDLFFYRGYWYRPYRGEWYFSAQFNGPWGRLAIGNVPPPLINLPPDYRYVPHVYRPLPYPMVRNNWRYWERERHWGSYGQRYAPGYRPGYDRYQPGYDHSIPRGGRSGGMGTGRRRG